MCENSTVSLLFIFLLCFVTGCDLLCFSKAMIRCAKSSGGNFNRSLVMLTLCTNGVIKSGTNYGVNWGA